VTFIIVVFAAALSGLYFGRGDDEALMCGRVVYPSERKRTKVAFVDESRCI
jgi:hypothetical protein